MNRPETPIVNYSCHFSQFREGEQFTFSHALGLIVSGTMELNDGNHNFRLVAGDLYLVRKNCLVKFIKQPEGNGVEFKSLSIRFDEQFLRTFSSDHNLVAEENKESSGVVKLSNADLLQSFMKSLVEYTHLLNDKSSEELLTLKQEEALWLLLKYNSAFKNQLFDFSEPYRIDLKSFMEKNYHFNVQLQRFAYLTGRSLSTFKRDFEKIFHQTPNRWLLNRRLQEAYQLITQEGKMPTEIYLDLGFENLSHFSTAFKTKFGVSPVHYRRNG